MASYQPQHQQNTRRPEQRFSNNSLESSWIVTELSRAGNENVFSDTLSSPLSGTRQSVPQATEDWNQQVTSLDHNLIQVQGLPTSMIRFPTHDGRGGFTLALTSHESMATHSTAHPQSAKLPSIKALSSHASTSSSILDDALPRHSHVSTDLSQRIHAWAQEQQMYTRLRHKRRRISADADQRIQRQGLEGWIWRFVSSLIGIDDGLLQIVLGEKVYETEEKRSSYEPSFWEGFLQRTSMEKHLASPFPSPRFQRAFQAQHEAEAPEPVPSQSRPTRQAPTPWDTPSRRQIAPPPSSSWQSLPADPIRSAPFHPNPVRTGHTRSESSHAPWGIEDVDILSTSTEIPDDYWDREFTVPLVWHIVKNYISTRIPRRLADHTIRSCKEESVGQWDDPVDGAAFYWHESVDGASSLGLGLGGSGTWAEV